MMKSKRIIPVLFILILSLWPFTPFVESAGYGEENENLGQFTDDFENDDNVSVAVNVINNQTLDCMELNFTADKNKLYENFTEYTQVEPNNRVDVINDTHVAHQAERDEDSYLYYNYGSDYFDDFTHEVIIEGDFSVNLGLGVIWMVSDTIDDFKGIIDSNGNCLVVYFLDGTTFNRIILAEVNNGALFVDFHDSIIANQLYFLNISKYGTDLDVYIYDDKEMTSLIDTLSLTLHTDHELEYIFGCNTYNDGTNVLINTDIYNLWIGRTTGGFESDGYFTTEDYLNYTTGNSLALLTNASIPYDTSITVQFSNDNATWVDNEGNVGSTPVLDGFYAIDLRDLNYTDSFKMYNLTTTDSTITPRLFQSRLITTNGTAGVGPGPGPTVIQNVTGEWIYYNLTTINVTVGTHDSGDLNSTLDIDGDTYNCSEVVGAPGYVIEFEWTDVDLDAHCLWVTAYIFYDGVSAHTINVDLWNFTSTAWVTIGIIYDMVDFEWVNSSIYDLRMPNDFINSTGAVRGRFYHASAGNINDDIFTNFLKLYAFIPSDVVTPTISEDNFFWVFIAIVLSIIVGLLMWLKDEHNNN